MAKARACPRLRNFPKNHNLILLGQPALNTTLQLQVNDGIRTRITYSATLQRLASAAITEFINNQLDQVGLPHSTFTEAAQTSSSGAAKVPSAR